MTETSTNQKFSIPALHRSQSGTALTEFAITAPVFLVLLSGVLMLSDITLKMSIIEAQAFQNTANAAMEVQRTSVFDSVGDPKLASHLSENLANARFNVDFTPATFPEVQPFPNPIFQSVYREAYRADGHVEDGLRRLNIIKDYADTAPPDLQEIVDNHEPHNMHSFRVAMYGSPGLGTGAVETQLWSPNGAISDGDGAMGDAFTYDTSESIVQNILSTANSLLSSSGTRHAIGAGIRYGVLTERARQNIEGQVLGFNYNFSYGSYYSTSAPTQVPGGSSKGASLRAIAVLRLDMLDGPAAYRNMLRIGSPADEGTLPDDDERFPMIWNVSDDHAPDTADDLFGPMLHYK